MSGERILFVECDGAPSLVAAAREARRRGIRTIDALCPFLIEDLDAAMGLPPVQLRPIMLVVGLASAAAMFLLQYWYSVAFYPLDSGGRAHDAWPAFMLATFETGVLGAAFGGFVAMLVGCGLPRLNHPLFDAPETARASLDGFFLLVADGGASTRATLAGWPGVVAVTEGVA